MTNNQYDHDKWIDFTKVIATFMVVMLHSAASWLYKYGDVSVIDWQIANFIMSTVRVSVPIFFMCTGYLLIGRKIFIRNFWNKRINRIFLPWIAWSFVYILWKVFYHGQEISFLRGVGSFLDGTVYFHLWFMYALFGLYLFVPIAAWFSEKEGEKRSLYFIVGWFLAASLIPFVSKGMKYVIAYNARSALDLSMFTGFSGYLLLGRLIGCMQNLRLIKWISLAVYIGGVVLSAMSTTIATNNIGHYVEFFYEYLAPNVVLMSLSAFVLLKYLGEKLSQDAIVTMIIKRLGEASFGIYLVHPIFLELLRNRNLTRSLDSFFNGTALSIPFVAIITFSLSYGVIKLIKGIPIIRRIT